MTFGPTWSILWRIWDSYTQDTRIFLRVYTKVFWNKNDIETITKIKRKELNRKYFSKPFFMRFFIKRNRKWTKYTKKSHSLILILKKSISKGLHYKNGKTLSPRDFKILIYKSPKIRSKKNFYETILYSV